MTLDGLMNLIKPETQDKIYQIGQISEKTGLQKTANGWRRPKTGNSAGGKKNSIENAKKMAESYRKTSNKPIYITEKDGDYVVAKGRDELEYAKENGYKLVQEHSKGSSGKKRKHTKTPS